MNRLDIAIEFAAKAHQNQKRKGTDIPYISHPFGVAIILHHAKCKEDIIIAGLLHDTLEDTAITEEEIRNQFGEEILRLVLGATEPDKNASWEVRKHHTLEYLKSADLAIRQLSCADKLHNLRSIRRDVMLFGNKIWDKFKRGYEEQKWYYTSLVESLGYNSRFSLLDTFQDEVESFFLELELSDEKKEVRRNKKLYDVLFELLFAPEERVRQIETDLAEKNLLELKKSIFRMIEENRYGGRECLSKKQEMFQYLTCRGIDFEVNSEGTDILMSACVAMKDTFQLYPHEVYHHFYRCLKKGKL